MSDQSSSAQQQEQRVPTSPPTNVVSVLSKMLETHIPQAENQEVQLVSTNKKKFLFYLDFFIDKQIQKCQVQVQEHMKVQQALKEALEKFKVILAQKSYEMDTALQNFTLRLAKKNGKPKTDMPSIDLKQKFIDIKVSVSSIQIKNPQCIKNLNPSSPQSQLQSQAQPSSQSNQQFAKTISHYSIGSEIGNEMSNNLGKKGEVLTQEEIMKKEKNQNCMFSFC